MALQAFRNTGWKQGFWSVRKSSTCKYVYTRIFIDTYVFIPYLMYLASTQKMTMTHIISTMDKLSRQRLQMRCIWAHLIALQSPTQLSVKQCNPTRHPALDVVSTSLPKTAEPVASSKPEWRCRLSGIQVGSKGFEGFENQAPVNMYIHAYLLIRMYLSHI